MFLVIQNEVKHKVPRVARNDKTNENKYLNQSRVVSETHHWVS